MHSRVSELSGTSKRSCADLVFLRRSMGMTQGYTFVVRKLRLSAAGMV